jgi:S-formylglutathione hydrolase FrmB
MEVEFYSDVLGLSTEAWVILPQKESGVGVEKGKTRTRYPTLYLLHGASDDHTIWLRRTNIERYVTPLGLAVVMPQAHLSRYANMRHGGRYADFFTEELPAIMRDFFPLSDKREDTFIAGLSMGGAGALSLGLSKPENYAAIGCFSAGNLNVRSKTDTRPPEKRASGKAPIDMAVYGTLDRASVFGNPDFDSFVKAEAALKSGKPLPRIFHAIGTSDFLYENAGLTRKWFEAHKEFDYTYREGPGAHTWDFWDARVQEFLKWLNLDTGK